MEMTAEYEEDLEEDSICKELASGIETEIRGLLYQQGMDSRMAPGMRGGLYLQGIVSRDRNRNKRITLSARN